MFTPSHCKLRNKSGTIDEGGTAQDVYAANDAPKVYLLFQNVSDTDMTIEFDTAAVADTGILIAAGTAWEPPAGYIFSGKLSVLCATTGKKFVCKIA